MNAEIEEYDRWTINYLRGVGVQGALLERVIRLVEEKDRFKAEAADFKQADRAAAKAGA